MSSRMAPRSSGCCRMYSSFSSRSFRLAAASAASCSWERRPSGIVFRRRRAEGVGHGSNGPGVDGRASTAWTGAALGAKAIWWVRLCGGLWRAARLGLIAARFRRVLVRVCAAQCPVAARWAACLSSATDLFFSVRGAASNKHACSAGSERPPEAARTIQKSATHASMSLLRGQTRALITSSLAHCCSVTKRHC